jgi:hypothetical protein
MPSDAAGTPLPLLMVLATVVVLRPAACASGGLIRFTATKRTTIFTKLAFKL